MVGTTVLISYVLVEYATVQVDSGPQFPGIARVRVESNERIVDRWKSMMNIVLRLVYPDNKGDTQVRPGRTGKDLNWRIRAKACE
jgi:hypothetical protein